MLNLVYLFEVIEITLEEKEMPDERKYLTGLRSLDQKLGMEFSHEKGIPNGTIILVNAPPSSNLPTLFVQRILLNLVEQDPNNIVFYLYSSRPRSQIVREFHSYNWDVERFENSQWFWENMYKVSSPHKASSSRIGNIDIRRKTYIKRLFHRILQIHQSRGHTPFTCIDNLLWMKEELLDEDPASVIEFLKHIQDYVDAVGGIHFLLLPKGILNPVAERILEATVQGIFDFKREIRGNRVRDYFVISKMVGLSYVSETLEVSPSEEQGFRIESTAKI